MVDDEFLQKLHHVLLEVRPRSPVSLFTWFLSTLDLLIPSDSHRRRFDDMSELQAYLPYLERDPQYGPFLSVLCGVRCSCHCSFLRNMKSVNLGRHESDPGAVVWGAGKK